ncbi:hypothetical protein [Kibdelosporangium aridum]|uniref:Uncharacterized protein n=1 Tax=Kibdelosporangium aridum TaxID=2030 RepID=A0A1Y5YAP6_KIBAR|nr:hypothetical protein [Kibdelosporangium aridum]SMD26739.1 hypothetical protein SAMN05661093_10325 [Kibdelosporangium aridum]
MTEQDESTPITTDPPYSPGTPEPPDLDVDAKKLMRKVNREVDEHESKGQEPAG